MPEETRSRRDNRTGMMVGIATLTVALGAIALGNLKDGKPREKEKGGVVHFIFEDGSRGRLHDIDGDSIVDAIVRIRHGQRPLAEFAAPEYMGKTPWHYHGTKEMDVRLRNIASQLYRVNRGFSEQVREALKREQKR